MRFISTLIFNIVLNYLKFLPLFLIALYFRFSSVFTIHMLYYSIVCYNSCLPFSGDYKNISQMPVVLIPVHFDHSSQITQVSIKLYSNTSLPSSLYH